MRLQRIRQYFIFSFAIGATILLGVILYANSVILDYRALVYHDISLVPTTTVTLVLGGGMEKPGVMSEMQTDRVLEAVALYKAHKTEKLIMSGDDGAYRDDEVTFMKEHAVKEGVPEKDISIDPHAYRTYLSCYRAKHEYVIEKMSVITQNFHLPRALYLCNEMGIQTIGLSADLRESYHGMWKIQIREVLARVKAVLEVKVTKPKH
jgi:vancomycin permeability regulator SanA